MQKKYNRQILTNATNRFTGRKVGIILGAIVVGCGCIIFSSFFQQPWQDKDNWRVLINVALSTLATVAFASVAWEGVAKYAFSRDVIDLVGLSDSIVDSGVFAVEKSFSDIAWNELIEGAKGITAIFTYSIKWGKDNRDALMKAKQNGCQIIVILPDIKANGILDALRFRFTGVDNIEGKISDAEEFYKNIGATIMYYPKTIQNSYYLIDDTGIMVPFNHQKQHGGHTPSVPAILASKPGHIYEYIKTEVEAISTESRN